MLNETPEGAQVVSNWRKAEIVQFPEFTEDDIYIDASSNYMYFSPSYLLDRGLLSTDGVSNMVFRDKSLLSVGAGRAYFERMLIMLGANAKNIVLSDIDPTVLPSGYKTTAFDMTRPWPKFSQKFDYVVFPESLVAVSQKYADKTSAGYLTGLTDCFENALDLLKPGGEVRAVSWFFPDQRRHLVKALAHRPVTVTADTFELVVVNS